MIDASKESLEENIRKTREVSDYCHRVGDLSVEGELGTVSGVEDQVKVAENEELLCDPDSAVDFVKRSGLDLFAPAIGTAHGVYKTADPKIDFNRLERIADRLKRQRLDVPLVVHGGTGLPPKTVKTLISLGGSKFNVSTELKITLIDTIYDYISSKRDEYDPGKIDKAVKQAIMEKIESWIDLLGCAGKA
jgi:ketose-bisphosphate aldolase